MLGGDTFLETKGDNTVTHGWKLVKSARDMEWEAGWIDIKRQT